jgi:hypothetical protein
MRNLKILLRDRRRRQRGSILSGVLIIVVFLSLLIGGLLTELTGAFTVSRDLVTRVNTEATVTSATELGIHNLQAGPVPAVCTHDNRGPWSLTLNGQAAIVSQTCSGIIPEQTSSLGAGLYNVDGIHDTVAGRNRFLVTDASGRLFSYPFGQSTPSWSIAIGGTPTASPLITPDPDGSVDILVPVAKNGAGCAGHCVVALNERGAGVPTFGCYLAATATVTARPGAEVSAGGSANFPGYVFFGDSGRLYAYDASSGGGCPQLDSVALGDRVVGAPLVFPGRASGNTVSDEVFVLVTSSTTTSLEHWRYTETNNEGDGEGNGKTTGLSQVGNSLQLTGVNAVGYGISSTVPTSGTTLSLAVATSGRLDVARIAIKSGAYTMSLGPTMVLPFGAVTTRAPYWCNTPCGVGGQDLIGVGTTTGLLYLFNRALTSTVFIYSGQPDGSPAINTTPMADVNGDWYFGANDGAVYDVEIPVSGVQMVKAAKFGPGGVIASSPIVGACAAGPCLYFGSTTAGYFVRIGSTRVSDLHACISSQPCSATTLVKPQLWARVQVGPPGPVGGVTGVFVQGWSYSS